MVKTNSLIDLKFEYTILMAHLTRSIYILALEVAAQDWPYLYEKNYKIYMEQYNKSKELGETKKAKQENYIFREQEYRKVIQDMKDNIDKISQKPLERTRNKSDDQKEMENINIRIRQNDPNANITIDQFDAGNKANNLPNNAQWPPEQKTVDEIWKLVDDFEDQISVLKEQTTCGLNRQKNAMWKKLDGAFTTYRQEQMADSLKKKQNDEDPLVREQSLNKNLEVMTHMAQQLDKEHRRLTDQQQKLKIQYSSQEKDSDLLLKQIIYYKKQHKQIKEEHIRMKEEVETQ